ncbi:hypothetical protein IQ254_30080 [Nodosilinea sp. LEGE 07088]|uniref:hypothetical protein n=1 Tax=Nodosilinea sp. LEGE 07088 TaxID=2777968 RepID=UPI00187FCA7D|nr:hypothetical protein [Nodosilinea sp. LEGE 07088]MBE9141393.1 hypothetical protein [Nodosilinea sp. LEGE 07088]
MAILPSAIATLLLIELHQPQPSGTLYLDSLANVLTVQLLRHHSSTLFSMYGFAPKSLQNELGNLVAYPTINPCLRDRLPIAPATSCQAPPNCTNPRLKVCDILRGSGAIGPLL